VQGLATEEVLVETFEEGVSISSFLMDPLPAKAMDEAIREGPPGYGGVGTADEKEKDDVGITGITGTSGAAGGDKVEEAAAKAARAAAYAAAVEVPEENKHLAALGVKTLLKMLIDDNFLHADLHPGNILVRLREGMVDGVPTGRGSFRGEDPSEDHSDVPSRGEEETTRRRGGSGSGSGSDSSGTAAASSVPAIKPEIVILDTGLATELTPHQQAGLAEFFQAIISWDGAGVANKIISFSSTPATNLDVEGFKRDISRAVGRFSESTPRAGDCMSAIFETVQRYHVTIDPNVMVAVVTVMVLEGWQFRLDPTINILDYIGDVLKSSFRKHQRLSMVDYALRDMWAPFSEPNALMLDRSGSRGRATETDGA
jgi:aarF domain-containing kinase